MPATSALVDTLAHLNRVGAAINANGAAGAAGVNEILRQVVESAAKVVSGSSVVIYPLDPATGTFDRSGRVASGTALPAGDEPPAGLGEQALARGRPVLSNEESRRRAGAGEAGGVSVAAFPLVAAGRPVGVLYLYRDVKQPLRELERLMLENFANQAVTAIDRARQLAEFQRDLERKEDELARLRYAGLLISSRLRLEETLQAILQMALEVTGAHYGVFRLVDQGGQNLVTRAIAGERLGRPATEPLPINATSIMGWVARYARPLRIRDLRAAPWARIYYPLDLDLEMRSELAVPLIGSGGRLEGVLNLESPQVDAFSEADSHLLQALATQAVIAIQQARLLDALQEIAGRLLTQPAPQVLARLAELAEEFLNRTAGITWSQRGEEAVLVAADAMSDWDQKVLTILNHYAALAQQNAARLEALAAAQEQRQVAETFAAMGDVAANLLHHLNNKVGTIPVRIEGIQDKCAPALADNPYLASNLAEIERSAAEAMQAVRESLSLLHPIHLEPLAVAGCVEAALAQVRLPDTITVQTEGLAGLPPVLAGRQGLTLVIVNLLANAAEAMAGRGLSSTRPAPEPPDQASSPGVARKRGVVIIRGMAGNPAGAVQITVSDDGPGIPPELHERIFDLNFSGRQASAGHKLGFGLWWVKTLVARLGGSIAVESDGSHGTTFRLKLPRAEVGP